MSEIDRGHRCRAGVLGRGRRGQRASPTPADLVKDPAVKTAIDGAKATEPQTIEDQIRFCEIPAPSFKEEVRGRELQRVFQQLGLQNVRVDKVGNVLGDYAGAARAAARRIAAHLDTVFPEGTDVKVKREGAVLRAGHRRRLPRPRRAGRDRPRDEEGEGADARDDHLRRERRRGRARRSARREGAIQDDAERSDRSVRVDRRHRHSRHQRRRRQPPLPGDVQGTGRSQLRRVRHGEPDGRDGPRDREDPGDPGAASSRRRRSTSDGSAAARR